MWKCRKVQVGCPTGGSSLEKTHCTGTRFLRTEQGLARKEKQLGDTEQPPKGEGDWTGENSVGGSDCPVTFAVSLSLTLASESLNLFSNSFHSVYVPRVHEAPQRSALEKKVDSDST